MDEILKHYGVLGMKWGVHRTPAQLGRKSKSKSKNGKSARFKSKAKCVARNTATFVASSVVTTVALNELLNSSTGQRYISSGKQYANSYIKKNGKKKMSDIETDKSWAEYAWDEVQRSGWG